MDPTGIVGRIRDMSARKTHTVVISDVHLCQVVPSDGLWMRYRNARFSPDAEIAAMLDGVRAGMGEGDDLEIVLNGDVFDFDAPPVIDGEVTFLDQGRGEDAAVQTIERILDDHAELAAALAHAVARGEHLIIMVGNHDTQVVFPGVQAAIRRRIGERILFRPWFHLSTTGIHLEHGNQYDPYCSYRFPTRPFAADGKSIQPTMGSLTFRNLASRLGYFNPHIDSTFMLTVPDYVRHWATYYLFTRRELVLAWVKGSIRTFIANWKSRTPADAAQTERLLREVASETALAPDLLQRQVALFVPPSQEARFQVFRELWLDRALMLLIALGVAAAFLAAKGEWASLKAAAAAATVILVYEILVPKPTLDDMYKHVDACEKKVLGIYGRKAIVFGHTHIPLGEWTADGCFIGNSGTWVAGFKDIACTEPTMRGKPVIWLRGEAEGPLEGGLYRWTEGAFVPWGPDTVRALTHTTASG